MGLVGRDEQIGKFDLILRDFVLDRVNTVIVEGLPGTGKTALLEELGNRSREFGALYLNAGCHQGEQGIPFNVIEQLTFCLDLPEELVSCLARLVDEGTAQGSSTGVLPEILRSLCKMLKRLAGERAVVIGVDDVQFADPLSLHCLLYLARRSHLAQTLLVVTCDEAPGRLLELPLCRWLETPLLSQAETERLLEQGVETLVPPEAGRSCYLISGGNPALVRALALDHVAVGRTETAAGGSGVVVGEAFTRAYLGLLRRHPDLLHAARAVAITGPEAPVGLAAHLVAGGPQKAVSDIGILGASGLLAGNDFRHPAARSAVLGELGSEERQDLHHHAAEWLTATGADPMLAVEHYVVAGRVPGPAAVSVLREAVRQLLRQGKPQRAAGFLRLADRADLDERQRTQLLCFLVEALMRVNPAELGPEVHRLVAVLRAGRLGFTQTYCLLGPLLWLGRFDEAAEVLDHLIDMVDMTDPEHTELLEIARGRLGLFLPSLQDRLPQPSASSAQEFNLSVVAQLERAPGSSSSQLETPGRRAATDPSHGWEDPSDSLYPNRYHGYRGRLFLALNHVMGQGRVTEASHLCDLALHEALRLGSITLQALTSSIRASIALWRGEMTAAADHAAEALKSLPPAGWGVVMGFPRAVLAVAHTAAGRHEEAVRVLREPLPDEAFQTCFALPYLLARADHYLATGRPHAALAEAMLVGRLADQWPRQSCFLTLPWRSRTAEIHLHLGQAARARELARQELDRLGDQDPRVKGIALRVLAAASEPAERLPLLRKAVKLLRRHHSHYELARCLADLSHAHRAAGDLAQADSLWRQALRLAEECGAKEPLCTVPGAGAGHLTDPHRLQERLSGAERRVATLASAGKSNRQIAVDLYITVSTVEQHLTRVYRKLGLRNRADLARVWERVMASNAVGPEKPPLAGHGASLVQQDT
jgi:DNA-binding CsgD family transcriptional regulator